MRRLHFERFAPICPVCRQQGRQSSALALEEVFTETDDDVVEGILRCTEPRCRHEFPILDGIPMIVPRLRDLVAGWIDRIRAREAFPEALESLLGDCCGPGSSYDDERQRVSSYTWDHWGDLDPQEVPDRANEGSDQTGSGHPGAIVRLLAAALDAIPDLPLRLPEGVMLDLGCAVGRTTVELAARFARPTLGIDLDIAMLRRARRIRDSGIVSYPRRRIGLAYDRRTFGIAERFAGRASNDVDYWCCDATALPFAADRGALLTSLNLLDCVASPLTALQETVRALAPGGVAVLATPFDWSPAATPMEGWIGGHSQRAAHRGAGDTLLRQVLTSEADSALGGGVRLLAERPALPWQVRLHERSTVHYRSDVVAIEKIPPAAP